MTVDEVARALRLAFSDAVVRVEGDGANFVASLISEGFVGLSRFQRQKNVLAIMKTHIASGDIHAFSVNAFTPAEWNSSQNQLSVIAE